MRRTANEHNVINRALHCTNCATFLIPRSKLGFNLIYSFFVWYTIFLLYIRNAIHRSNVTAIKNKLFHIAYFTIVPELLTYFKMPRLSRLAL